MVLSQFCHHCLKVQLSKPLWSLVTIHRVLSSFKNLEEEPTAETIKAIEKKWKGKINFPLNTVRDQETGNKFYLLSMFPYPSGDLHMGHVRVYTVSDALARFHSMQGKQVIHPMGWDAFGLPAENAAIDKKQQPESWTRNNIASMKQQLMDLGITFDWSREFATCDSKYYKWTQYLFLQMYDKGLAYRQKALVNWDPVDQTVLADEQIDENGCSWRSGAKAEKRHLTQWFLRTSLFSKPLYDGLDNPDVKFSNQVKKIQRNWIGQCTGYIFNFKLILDGKQLDEFLTVWTEHPEFIFGVTYIAVSSEHYLNSSDYFNGVKTKSECKLPLKAVHPFTGNHLPIFISEKFNYPPVSDCHIGIPGEIIEDKEFATMHNLPKIKVIDGSTKTLINSEQFTGMSLFSAKKEICNKAQKECFGGFQASSKLRDWLVSRQRYWGTPIPIIHCPSCKKVPVPYEQLPVELPVLTSIKGKGTSPLLNAEQWLSVKCPKCGMQAKRETDTLDTFVDSAWYYLRFLDPENYREPFDRTIINKLLPVDLYIGGLEHADVHLFYARFFSHFCYTLGLLKSPEPFYHLLCQGYVKGKTYYVEDTGKYLREENVDFSGTTQNNFVTLSRLLAGCTSCEHPNKAYTSELVLACLKAGSCPVEKETGKSLSVNWEKMSKSRYNGVCPNETIEKYGLDTVRLYILGLVSPETEYHWDLKEISTAAKFQRRMWLTVHDFLRHRNNLDTKAISDKEWKKWQHTLNEKRNDCIRRVTYLFGTCQPHMGIKRMQILMKTMRQCPPAVVRNSDIYERTLAAVIIMSTPATPHFCSELWSKFVSAATKGQTGYDITKPVVEQLWPEMDVDYKLDLKIIVNDETVDCYKVTQEEMNSFTKQDALNIALSLTTVQNAIKGRTIKTAEFVLLPKYQLVMDITLQNKNETEAISESQSL